MSARPPASPPRIPGFTFIRALGQGGFADVYLYQQDSPRRTVAVKVLIAEMAGTEAAVRLRREADAMAGLSQHQNIVTVFQSGTADDGRAYMVMEYYPRPAYSQGLRTTSRSLTSVLSIGIQLAGAVESAHRLGILHRDIKPANILGDRAGRPVLGDFGIAMTSAEAAAGSAQGMSIPYSPPETFDANPHPLPQSDVWGLAATLYALLTGHAPFEIVGGDNRPHIMVERIKHDPYRPVGRQDVPPVLDQVLATAMSKNPTSRYATMQAFGRALGEVEQELHLSSTPMDIIDTGEDADAGGQYDEVDGTQLRPITMIDPTGWSKPPTISVMSPTASMSQTSQTATRQPFTQPFVRASTPMATPGTARGLADQPLDHTQLFMQNAAQQPVMPTMPAMPVQTGAPEVGEPEPRNNLRWVIVALVVLIIVAVVLVVVLKVGGQPSPVPADVATPTVNAQDPLGADTVSSPTNLVCTLSADKTTANCTWVNPDPQPGDSFKWGVTNGTDTSLHSVGDPAASNIPVPAGQPTVCVTVVTIRAGHGSDPVQGCAS